MICVKRIILDVLKPHQPNALEFCRGIAAAGTDCRVRLTVIEVDEDTETLQILIEATAIDFDAIEATIKGMGGSVHSIDEVEVQNGDDPANAS
jgi:hypothetical protein